MSQVSRESKVVPMKFENVYLLHGLGGSPEGSVFKLEHELRWYAPALNYVRPLLPHSEPGALPIQSVAHLRGLAIPNGSLVIGISLGGLVAASFQELERPDLHVICISSPTFAMNSEVSRRVENRISLYSSADPVIAGRTARWPELAEAYDLYWLTHETDKFIQTLGRAIASYLEYSDIARIVAPRVGFFLDLGEHHIVLSCSKLAEARDSGELKVSKDDFESFWAGMVEDGVVPNGSDYREKPRGRVVYNTKTRKFILYADACILNDKVTLRRLRGPFQLPPDIELKSDPQYRCLRCLGRE